VNIAMHLQALAQISSGRILNCTIEGIGIALFAWILLRAFGRQNSGTQFAVWFSALLAIAMLPLLDNSALHGAKVTKHLEITMPGSWALYIFAVWLFVVAIGLIRIAAGYWHVLQLRKSCGPINAAELDPLLRKTLEQFDSHRPVAVCVSERLRVPTAIGFFKPIVVLPAWTMQELSATELNTILLHELAHIRRWDDWTNLIQRILGAFFFFHPVVWWIEKKLSLEREMACDDIVLEQATSPRTYAECLISLAEKSFLRRGLSLAQAAVDGVRHISLRISQILDENRAHATPKWKPAPLFLTGLSLASLVVFSYTPRLVSFENTPQSPAASTAASINPLSENVQANSLPDMGSNAFFAKLEVGPESKSAMQAHVRTGQGAAIPTKVAQRRVTPAMLVRAAGNGDDVVPETLMLVIQTEQYEVSGSAVWNVYVWQVSIAGPAQIRTETGIIGRSI